MESADYSKYMARLSSYSTRKWPSFAPQYIKDLVESGLVYTGDLDIVFCFCCGETFSEWKDDENPIERHYEANSNCSFIAGIVQKRNCDSKPVFFEEKTEEALYDWIPGQGVIPKENSTLLLNKHDELQLFNDKMKSNRSRFQSFVSCPPHKHWPDVSILAAAGFYYDKLTNETACFCCGLSVKNWDCSEQDAVQRHRALSSKCEFICCELGKEFYEDEHSDNLQSESKNSGSPQLPELHNTCENKNIVTGTGVENECRNTREYRNMSYENHWQPIGPAKAFHSTILPPATDYSNEHDRLRTFFSYPFNSPVSAISLAEAGFYYLNRGDKVVCYKCNLGLEKFQVGDTAWGEHKKHSPACPLVCEKFLGSRNKYATPHLRHPTHQQPGPARSQWNYPSQYPCNFVQTTDDFHTSLEYAFNSFPTNNNSFQGSTNNTRACHSDPMFLNECSSVPYPHQNSANGNSFSVPSLRHESVSSGNVPNKLISHEHLNYLIDKGFSPDLVKDALRCYYDRSQQAITSLEKAKQVVASHQRNYDLRQFYNGQKIDDLVESKLNLEEKNVCKICMDAEVAVTFLPCGHLIACVKCAKGHKVCPICRMPIVDTCRTYLS